MKVFVSYVIEKGSEQKYRSEVINTFVGLNLPYNQCELPSVYAVHKWMEQKRETLKNEGTLTLLGMSKVR